MPLVQEADREVPAVDATGLNRIPPLPEPALQADHATLERDGAVLSNPVILRAVSVMALLAGYWIASDSSVSPLTSEKLRALFESPQLTMKWKAGSGYSTTTMRGLRLVHDLRKSVVGDTGKLAQRRSCCLAEIARAQPRIVAAR